MNVQKNRFALEVIATASSLDAIAAQVRFMLRRKDERVDAEKGQWLADTAMELAQALDSLAENLK